MISMIFVACLLAGSALGYPMFNPGNVMHPPMQPYYNSPSPPQYAIYPCESREDPFGQWVTWRDQQHYVHVAECQQQNGQNNCAYQSAQNFVHPQTQPMMIIQPTNNCARENCERICIQNSCFVSAVITPNGYTGETESYGVPQVYVKPAEPTTTTSAPTAAPTAAPTTAPTAAPTAAPTTAPTAAPTAASTPAPASELFEFQSFIPSTNNGFYAPPQPIIPSQSPYRSFVPSNQYNPQIPFASNVPTNFNFVQKNYIKPSKNFEFKEESEEYEEYNEAPEDEEENSLLEVTNMENNSTPAPVEPSNLSEVKKYYVSDSPSPVEKPKQVECSNVYGCAPGSQQHVVYHQYGSSSSAASAASAGGASASASASAGSASASASAAASSPHMTFPGVPMQYNLPYLNQASPCQSNGDSSPCEVQYKKSASVNQNGISIQVSNENDDAHDARIQLPCQNSPCAQ